MKKWLVGILPGILMLCCGAADNYKDLMKAGKAALNAKKYEEASATYLKAGQITKSPYYKSEALNGRVQCLVAQKKYEEAIALLQTTGEIKDVPPFCITYADYYSGLYAEKLKKEDEALKYYLHGSKMARDCDKPFECMLKAGAILAKQKKYKEALELYTGCKDAKNPDKAVNGYISASGIYQHQFNDLDNAMKMLAEAEKFAVKMKGNDGQLRVIYFRGYLYRHFKKFDEALNEFLKVKNFQNPQKDWAAALYSGAAGIAFDNKKDVKLAKELMAASVAYKSSWGTSAHYKKVISEAK